MYEFKLPDLGEGIHEGEILKWYVDAGQTIVEDDPLVEVETDKAAVTIPSPVGGTVVSLGGRVGEIVTVGAVIAVISGNGAHHPGARRPVDEPQSPETTSPESGSLSAPAGAEEEAPATTSPASSSRPLPAAPATRRLARELGVDLRLVTPTGPAGRVTPEDVRRHAEQPGAAPDEAPAATTPEAEFAAHAASAIPFLDLEPLPDFSQWGKVDVEPLRSIRRKVAHKMTTSMILVPHVAHMDEADVTELEAFRRREKERRAQAPKQARQAAEGEGSGVDAGRGAPSRRRQDHGQPGGRLTLLAFVVKAVTAGLRAAPAFNASLDPFREQIVYKKYYNIGIAADTGRGLVVPVVRETDRKSIIQIAADIEQLATQAREGKLEADAMRGGTFTITNIGPLGGTALIPAINYPEVAILGMGRVQEKPVVRDGEIVVRKMLPLTLAFDHRIADGADAARFVSELVRHLSDPNLLLLET
jgi:pyruvate dehydrogenase E2 component (dihydrolipoamide acetyltransferase)